MALHTGETEERDGDYFGPAVNRAARLMGVAHGGQVLVSLPTAEIVRSMLPGGLGLIERGEVELRSFTQPERVYELTWPGSPVDAGRSTRPIAARSGRVPALSTPVIGRPGELASIRDALGSSRLVTLVGVGGVGKTTLATAVASSMQFDHPDGAWFCELAAVGEPTEVVPAIAETLGLRPQAGLAQEELVVRALAQQQCLLVVDNCEHVIDIVARLLDTVLRRAPGVHVLATSREALGISGERVVSLLPLAADDAVSLLVARVTEHEAAFVLSDAESPVVGELCARLDGLPLAIELAAARARSMPLADLVARLGDRFRLLRGQRLAAERHQTLRATVAWSYELLTETERTVFDRLAPFAGGFTLDAAELVCADDLVERWEVAEAVAALADKSMVTITAGGRYLLLETLRQFGEERLEAGGDLSRFRTTHARVMAAFVAAAHDGLQALTRGSGGDGCPQTGPTSVPPSPGRWKATISTPLPPSPPT